MPVTMRAVRSQVSPSSNDGRARRPIPPRPSSPPGSSVNPPSSLAADSMLASRRSEKYVSTDTSPSGSRARSPPRAKVTYELIDELPPLLNTHVMNTKDGIAVGTNQYPYEELLQAKDAALGSQLDQRRKASPKRKPEKLNLAQKEERGYRAAVAAVRASDFLIILSDISARDVPDADVDRGWSDPYASFAMLDCDGVYDELVYYQLSGETFPIRNATSPVWPEAVKLYSPPAAGGSMWLASQEYSQTFWEKASRHLLPSEQEMTLRKPFIQIRILDKDIDATNDELLGITELYLGPDLSGSYQDLTLHGCGGFADCKISFKYQIVPYTTTQPARLTLHHVELRGVDPQPRSTTHERLFSANTRSTTPKKGDAPRKGCIMPSGPYVCFTLLEVAKEMRQAVRTIPYTKTLGLELYLPMGSRRPPLLRAQLFDNSVIAHQRHAESGQKWLTPLATMDIRLDETDGSHVTKLHYKITAPNGKPKLKTVEVQFAHTIEPLAGEIQSRLSRVGLV